MWDESEWHQEALGGGGLLTFAESSFTYEYAACGGAVLTNCALIDEETAPLTPALAPAHTIALALTLALDLALTPALALTPTPTLALTFAPTLSLGLSRRGWAASTRLTRARATSR